MNLTRFSLSNPYAVIALALMVVALGLFSFWRTPTDLFPDTAPPQVVVVTVEPGAAAKDIADKITQLIEKELNTISGLKRIRSTSRDEVSSVTAEFFYDKPIGEAVTDVQNAVARIRARLPRDILEPQIYRITDATRSLMTIALSPKQGSTKDLVIVRQLAENEIKDALLRVPGVGDIDVFGAHQPEVQVRVDRDKMAAYHLDLGRILGQLTRQNVAAPAGTVYTRRGEYLVRVEGEFQNLDELRNLPLLRTDEGRVLLRDVAAVRLAQHEPRSGYRGNAREAIGLNILRPEGGETVSTIRNVKGKLAKLKKRYPDIRFDITDDQEPIIDVNIRGMRSSVYQAIILTTLVVLIFLADLRAALAVSLGIPLSFLAALTVLWFSPYTLNMVTLSGLVIAVGLVLDASIVVLENIYRHYRSMRDPDAERATLEGSDQVRHGIIGGMLTTVIVLIPVMFAGGYTQQVMRPLNLMISSTITASLIISMTVLPLLASRLIGRRPARITALVHRAAEPFGNWVTQRAEAVSAMTRWVLRHRGLTVILALFFVVFTMRGVAPLNGRELMPAMDTGIGIISFDTPTQYTPVQVKNVAARVERMLWKQTEGLKWISTIIGSEPGEVSFGGGGTTAQSVKMIVTLVDRKHRKASIWDMERRWRTALRKIPGVRTFHVTEFGATPLSTTKAPLDIVISGPDGRVLDRLADEVVRRLRGIKGLTDVRRSWYFDKVEENVEVDPDLARFYGTTPAAVAHELRMAVKGIPAGSMRVEGALDIPITVQYRESQVNRLGSLQDVVIPTPGGLIPLRALAKITTVRNQPFITREDLYNTIDITGINSGQTIGHVGKQVRRHLRGIKLPEDYSIKISGTLEDMKIGNAEMGRALLIGIVMLYILLVSMFKSFSHPITIMSSIVFAVASAMWGLLIFHKPMCKPAMMGIILLAGTVVNNVIILLDFIIEGRRRGMSKDDAIVEAVRLRFRPILMTALSASIGLLPLVFEMAVGMERLSPLGIVAAVGLLAGVFISTLIIPAVYSLIDGAGAWLAGKGPGVGKAGGVTLALIIGIGLGGLPLEGKAAEMETDLVSSTSVEMDLREAVEYALDHSPVVEEAAGVTEERRGDLTASRAALLPQVNVSAAAVFSDLDHVVTPGVPPSDVRFADRRYQHSVSVSQLLYDFGRSWHAMMAARLRWSASTNIYRRRVENVAFRVAAAFHQRLLLNDLQEATEARRLSLATLASNISARVEVGKSSNLDLLKARVRLAAIESSLAEIASRRTETDSQLMALLGYQGSVPKWRPTEETDRVFTSSVSTEELIREALADRPDCIAAREAVAAAQSARAAAVRSRLPQIMLFGAYNNYGADSPKAGNPQAGSVDDWESDYSVGVEARLPLFDSGLRAGRIASATARLRQARARLRAIRLAVEHDVRTAVAQLESARARASALDVSVKEARRALEDEKLKYAAGKSVINDVLDAEAALLESVSKFSRARHEEAIAWFNLQLALGRPVEKWFARQVSGPGAAE